MSEFHVQVVQVGPVTKHPNADSLSCSEVDGYPVIFRTGDYVEGDRAVYVPVDAIVPDGCKGHYCPRHCRRHCRCGAGGPPDEREAVTTVAKPWRQGGAS